VYAVSEGSAASSGLIYAVNAGTHTYFGGTRVVADTGPSTTEPPVIDSSTEEIFTFTGQGYPGSASPGQAAVVQQSIAAFFVVHTFNVGTGSGNPMHLGAFNNAYLTNGPSDSNAYLYVCGDDATADASTLYALPFTAAGLLTTPSVAGSGMFMTSSASAQGSCSSITENYNLLTGIDSLFVGVTQNCVTGETGGCVLSYDVTSGFPGGGPVADVAEPGGTSGIVVDNVVDQSGEITTDIYFQSAESGGVGQSCQKYDGTSGPTGNCAISLTQTGLN
jgi:hypothetical protein